MKNKTIVAVLMFFLGGMVNSISAQPCNRICGPRIIKKRCFPILSRLAQRRNCGRTECDQTRTCGGQTCDVVWVENGEYWKIEESRCPADCHCNVMIKTSPPFRSTVDCVPTNMTAISDTIVKVRFDPRKANAQLVTFTRMTGEENQNAPQQGFRLNPVLSQTWKMDITYTARDTGISVPNPQHNNPESVFIMFNDGTNNINAELQFDPASASSHEDIKLGPWDIRFTRFN